MQHTIGSALAFVRSVFNFSAPPGFSARRVHVCARTHVPTHFSAGLALAVCGTFLYAAKRRFYSVEGLAFVFFRVARRGLECCRRGARNSERLWIFRCRCGEIFFPSKFGNDSRGGAGGIDVWIWRRVAIVLDYVWRLCVWCAGVFE